MHSFYLLICLSILLCSCETKSLEYYRSEGREVTRSLIEELQKIHHHHDAVEASPHLNHHFRTLVATILEAHAFQDKHHLNPLPLQPEDHLLSTALREELHRVYGIEGCREVIEKCQEIPLTTLDRDHQHRARVKDESLQSIF